MLITTMPVIPITPLEREVRDIVGRRYDADHGEPPERFDPRRALTIVAIPGCYEHCSHVSFTIRGTPPRGFVVLSVAYLPRLAFDCLLGRRISEGDAEVLLRFVTTISGVRSDAIPRRFHWTSRDDIRDDLLPSDDHKENQ